MPLQDEYQVTLDAFCGPLDLLLFLIRRAEVDIHEIQISLITEQYLGFLRQVEDIDIEAASEFLVMAATLMEIKSRTLMPPEPEIEGGDGETAAAEGAATPDGEPVDPRMELIQQLLEYQRYRIAAESLERRRHAFERMFPAAPFRAEQPDPEQAEPVELELEDAHVYDLYESYERITAAIDFSRLGDHRIEMDDTPAALYQQDLIDRLERAELGALTLQDVFEGQRRVQRLGLFLAALELVRLRRVRIRQEDLAAAIRIELRSEDELQAEPEPVTGTRPLEPWPEAEGAD